jgi:hypothetical protein
VVWWLHGRTLGIDGVCHGQYFLVCFIHGLRYASQVLARFQWLIYIPGAWFLTYAATLQPFYNAAGAYAPTPGATQAATQSTGQLSPGYPSSFGTCEDDI